MTPQSDTELLLDAAEELFYELGYQAVGMDALREASGLSLKRIYSLIKGKDAIAVAMLDRRDERWHSALAERVDAEEDPDDRVLAAFDWLADWLSGPGHRGCAWINAYGELGGTSPEVAAAVRRHKTRLRQYVRALAADAHAEGAADAIFLLAEGCMVTAGIEGNVDAVAAARSAAHQLLRSNTKPKPAH